MLLQQAMAAGVSLCCMTCAMAMVFACSWMSKHSKLTRRKRSTHRRMLPTSRPGVAALKQKSVAKASCSLLPAQKHVLTAVGFGTLLLTSACVLLAATLWLTTLPVFLACTWVARLSQLSLSNAQTRVSRQKKTYMLPKILKAWCCYCGPPLLWWLGN